MKLVVKVDLISVEQDWPLQHIQDFIWTYERLKKTNEVIPFAKFLRNLKYKPEQGGKSWENLNNLEKFNSRLIKEFHTFSNRVEIHLADMEMEKVEKPKLKPYAMIEIDCKGLKDYYGIRYYIPKSVLQEWDLEEITEAGINMNGDELTLSRVAPGVLTIKARKIKLYYSFWTMRAKWLLEKRGENPFSKVKNKEWEFYSLNCGKSGEGNFTSYKFTIGKKIPPIKREDVE